MAAPNRWAVREAAEATFYSLESPFNPVVTLRTLKMTEVQTTGETVYAQGGRGNARLVGFSGNKEATVALQDAIFDNQALAMLTGNAVTTGERTLDKFFEATVGEDGLITLPFTPVADSQKVYPFVAGALGEQEALTTGYTIASNVVTIVDAVAGDKYRVYYKTTVGSAKTITVTASDFGGTFRLVCDVLVRDAETSKVYYAQFIAPKAKIEDEFTFSFSPEGDPSVLDIPLQLLKDSNSDNMWELVIYDEEEV